MLDAYDFVLPPDRVAQHPMHPRDAARMLCVAGEALTDARVRDLPLWLRPGDLMIVNDTRVIPAQLTGLRGTARIPVTLNRPLPDGAWHALARNTRRLRVGDRLVFSSRLSATLLAPPEDGGIVLRFDQDGEAFLSALREAGAMALPPYIKRPDGPTAQDAQDYQTLFAAREGAVAAPTAGLHFTPDLLGALAARGVARETVTLHVGAGTFLPLRAENLTNHRLHPEYGEVSADLVARVAHTRAQGGRIIAIGTTTLRILEAAAQGGELQPFRGETDIFIQPGHVFGTADLLLTNFHLPRSSLFMLVAAFAGLDAMRAAYAHAIATGYRFYSYGDASLLSRA